VASDEINARESVTYICSNCGYAARDFEPAVCAVCGAEPEQFQKLDKKAIESLIPLEGGVEIETTFDDVKLQWTADARSIVKAIPDGYQRRRARAQIEKNARVKKIPTITKDLVLEVTGETEHITQNLESRGTLNQTATDVGEEVLAQQEIIKDGKFRWTTEAVARLNRVPEGFMRKGTKKRMEACALKHDTDLITIAIAEEGIQDGLKMMEEMIKKQNEKK
jgi:hypothetical protein